MAPPHDANAPPCRVAAWRCLLLAMLCAVAAAAAAPPFAVDRASPYLLWQADFAITDGAPPPGPGAAWQPVPLPDSWRGSQRWQRGRDGWYRFTLPGPAPAEPVSVYLWRFSMNAAVWFNGEPVGDGGSFDEPVARNWNRPLLLALPAAMWRGGENTLLVRLRTYPGFGHLMPVAVGPTALLKPDHERRTFTQITLSQVAAGFTVLAMLTGAILWLVERRDAAQPYFVAFCLAWLVYGTNTFLRDIPVPAKTWWWAVHTSVDACYWLIVCFFHRLLGVRRPRIERLLLAWTLLCSTLYAAWSLPDLARWNPPLHGVSTLGGVYLAGWLLLQAKQRPGVETLLFALTFIAVFAGGIYDQLLNALLLPDLWRSRFYLLHLVMPVMFLGLIALLALRAARSMREVRAAKDNLEARVQAAGAQIEEVYRRERLLLAERSAAGERERIYRDLHDNLGARLLSLVYSARDERQATLARAALAEMRTLIATSQAPGGALSDLATDWRVEAELRCEDAGVGLDWRVEGDAALSGRQRLHLDSMLRELVSNALEHARCRRLGVTLQAVAGQLRLVVDDDGRGIHTGSAGAGRGLASVRDRAQALGGRAEWQQVSGGGTRCEVVFALDGQTGAP